MHVWDSGTCGLGGNVDLGRVGYVTCGIGELWNRRHVDSVAPRKSLSAVPDRFSVHGSA